MPIVIRGTNYQPLGGGEVPQSGWRVQVKRLWGDDWQTSLNLLPLRVERHCLSMGTSQAVLLGRYGPAIKQTHESAFGSVSAPDFTAVVGWWVRISLYMNGMGERVIFVGRVEREAGHPQGDDYGAQGDKTYICSGPEAILAKIEFYRSFWNRVQDGQNLVQELGWLPHFNQRDDRKRGLNADLNQRGLGNRDGFRDDDGERFGGSQLWTHEQALEMLIKRYVEQDGAAAGDAPRWRVGGQVQYLADLKAEIELEDVENVRDVLERIVATKWGLDCTIKPVEHADFNGFEVNVHGLLGESTAYGGYSYPLNPRRLSLSVSSDYSIADCQIERDAAALYDRVELVGGRIVSCLSLTNQSGGLPYETLVKGWTALQEDLYRIGFSSSGTAAKNDSVRAGDQFRDVWQRYKASAGFAWMGQTAVPLLGPDGQWQPGQPITAWQNQVRHTLGWLPLKEGVDYSVAVPVEPAELDAEFRPPCAIVRLPSGFYVETDKINMVLPKTPSASARPLEYEWGVRLESEPNHLFARGHATTIGPGSDKANKSNFDPGVDGVDWNQLIVTIAIPADHRLVLRQDLPPELQSGQGLVKCVHAPQLQCWFLAPHTVVGHTGNALQRAPANGTLLRSDRDHGLRIMAGAIARFLRERIRVAVTFRGLSNWNVHLGAMIETVEDGQTLNIGSPLSSVVWDFEARATTILSGQAIGTGQGRQRSVAAARRPGRQNVALPGDQMPKMATRRGR